mgnify:CR=1 FL=1
MQLRSIWGRSFFSICDEILNQLTEHFNGILCEYRLKMLSEICWCCIRCGDSHTKVCGNIAGAVEAIFLTFCLAQDHIVIIRNRIFIQGTFSFIEWSQERTKLGCLGEVTERVILAVVSGCFLFVFFLRASFLAWAIACVKGAIKSSASIDGRAFLGRVCFRRAGLIGIRTV